jgi:RES domain-containing protein
MTPTIWRIVKAKHAANAFDGEGARLFGGRWNNPGTSVVYCSHSLALAALEIFVHLDQWQIDFELVAIPVTFPAKISNTQLTSSELKALLKQQDMQTIGSEWASGKKSCVLRVPSAIIPQEENIILNPQHDDFKQIKIGAPQPFNFDERLTKQLLKC